MRRAEPKCASGDLIAAGDFINPTWRIACHTLYYTQLYLQPTPWEHHQTGIHDLDDIPAPPEIQELADPRPQTGKGYMPIQRLRGRRTARSRPDVSSRPTGRVRSPAGR
jgi:hypothetical protein